MVEEYKTAVLFSSVDRCVPSQSKLYSDEALACRGGCQRSSTGWSRARTTESPTERPNFRILQSIALQSGVIYAENLSLKRALGVNSPFFLISAVALGETWITSSFDLRCSKIIPLETGGKQWRRPVLVGGGRRHLSSSLGSWPRSAHL